MKTVLVWFPCSLPRVLRVGPFGARTRPLRSKLRPPRSFLTPEAWRTSADVMPTRPSVHTNAASVPASPPCLPSPPLPLPLPCPSSLSPLPPPLSPLSTRTLGCAVSKADDSRTGPTRLGGPFPTGPESARKWGTSPPRSFLRFCIRKQEMTSSQLQGKGGARRTECVHNRHLDHGQAPSEGGLTAREQTSVRKLISLLLMRRELV